MSITKTAQLIVSLQDKLSGPARGLTATIDKLSAASRANAARMGEIRGRMLDAVGAGYALYRGLSAPLRAATQFETKLEDIGQKIDAPVSALPKLGEQIRAVARDVTQSASTIADGMDVLTGMGASGEDALGLLGPIGKAATAYNASIADLSQAGYAALDNLKVPAEQFGAALDAMAQAGKAGAFELRDMATYFPALGAGYQALGQTGVPAVADLAAALQIVRKGTGDSASAATNLTNVLQKMRAPQTVKAFAKMGVNLEKELKRAAESGLTPIEAIAEITNKTLKGDLSKLGYLFSDAQVQAGLRPLLQNLELYREIRAEALAAQGVVEEDYARRLETGAMAGRRFAIALENINTGIGSALLPAFADLAGAIVPFMNRFAEFAEANPRLTRGLVMVTAALIGFRVAVTGAQFAGLFMKGAMIDMAAGALRAVRVFGSFTAAPFLALANPVAALAGSFRLLKVALVGSGVGIALLAVGAAGVWIWRNWDGLSTMVSAFGTSFTRAIEPMKPLLDPVIAGVSSLVSWVSDLLGPVDGLGQSWFAMGTQAGDALGGLLVTATELPGRIMTAWSGASWGDMGNAVTAGMGSVWDGYVSAARSAVSTVGGLLAAVDWTAGLSAASSAISGAFDLAAAGIMALDWSRTGEIIGSAIAAGVGAMLDLGALIMSPFTSGGGGDWTAIGATVGAAVAAGFLAVDWSAVGSSALNLLGVALRAGGNLLRGIVKGLFGFDLVEDGARLAQSLWDGVAAKIDEMVQWFSELPRRILAAIGSIDIGSLIKWPTPPAWWTNRPAWLGGGSAAPAPDVPGRERGGPVQAGQAYIVGEKRPELFLPRVSGRILPEVPSPVQAYAAARNPSPMAHAAPPARSPASTGHDAGERGREILVRESAGAMRQESAWSPAPAGRGSVVQVQAPAPPAPSSGPAGIYAPISLSITVQGGGDESALVRKMEDTMRRAVKEVTDTLDRQLRRSSDIAFGNLRYGDA